MITQNAKLFIIIALSLLAIASAYFLAKQSPFCKISQTNAPAHTSIDKKGFSQG